MLMTMASISDAKTTLAVIMQDTSKNNRLADKERRDFDSEKSLAAESLERRKRPDRRMGGLDVQVVDVSETAFLDFVDEFKLKK